MCLVSVGQPIPIGEAVCLARHAKYVAHRTKLNKPTRHLSSVRFNASGYSSGEKARNAGRLIRHALCANRFSPFPSRTYRAAVVAPKSVRMLSAHLHWLERGIRIGTAVFPRLPYPWNFGKLSAHVIEAAGGICQNPECAGTDKRMTTHHINYNKSDCALENLIALCSSCNSKANFGRAKWEAFYKALPKKHGGGWSVEEF